MSQITISILIVVIVMILYATQVIPMSVTSILGAFAMAAFGIISFADSISSFGSDALILVPGAIIMGTALDDTGVTKIVGNALVKIPGVGQNERLFLGLVLLAVATLSGFLSNSATVAMFMPLIAGIAKASGGKITKKNTYMAVGMIAVIGGNLTLVGSTPQLIANGILEETGCDTLSFFELSKGAVVLILITVVYFMTIGYSLQKKVFNFEEVADENALSETDTENNVPKWKTALSALIFCGCIFCFITGIGTVGTIAIVGAGLCIATGCISEKRAFQTMDWRAVVIMGGALGFAKGLNQSGAIALIAEKALALFGGESANPYVVCVALFILASILGNIVSHAATSAIMTPLAIAMALALGVNPKTFVIAMILGSNCSTLTPISTPPITMTLVGGYRFNDYVKVGGVLNIINMVAGSLLVPLIYGL